MPSLLEQFQERVSHAVVTNTYKSPPFLELPAKHDWKLLH